jgi:hypothetical protein
LRKIKRRRNRVGSGRRWEADVREKAAVTLVVPIAGVLLAAAAFISSTASIRPYGEQAILAQISQDDRTLCAKVGVTTATPNIDDCMRDLADLRQRHVDLLRSYAWL